MNDIMRKGIRVAGFKLNKRFREKKVILLAFCTLIYLHYYLHPVALLCEAVGIKASPWFFPFFTSGPTCQVFLVIGAMFWLSDLGRDKEESLFILSRCGSIAWEMGNILECVTSTGVYLGFIVLGGWGMYAGQLTFLSGWGKIWGALVRQGLEGPVPVPMDFYPNVMQFSALEAMGMSFLLEWMCLTWLALISYIVGRQRGRFAGALLVGAFIFLDIMIWNNCLNFLYRVSPVSLCQLNYFEGSMSRFGVTRYYAFVFFVGTGLAMCGLLLLSAKKRHTLERIL